MLADSGISPERLLQTIMVIRPFPIRISNVTKTGEIIYTGSYGKGDELTWTQINLASMCGGYPFRGDVNFYDSYVTTDKLKKLFSHCPEVYLKQIFGENYRSKTTNTIFDKSEQTTVTKMERRVFDLDINKLKTNCKINTPSSLYLNFFQHLESDFQGKIGNFEDYYFNRYLREYFNWIEHETCIPISALGTGPKNNERILKKDLIKEIEK